MNTKIMVVNHGAHINDMCIINLIIGPNKSCRRRRRFLCFIRENVEIPDECLKKTFDARCFQFTIERIGIDINRVREYWLARATLIYFSLEKPFGLSNMPLGIH